MLVDPRCGFGNVLVIEERDGTDNFVAGGNVANDRRKDLPGTLEFIFSQQVEIVSIDALDFGDTGDVRFFLDGIRLNPVNGTSDGVSGDNLAEKFVPDAAGAARRGTKLEVVFDSSGGIDNIKVNVVPLPAGAWLLLSGFGLVAGTQRWRKRAA